VTNQRQKSPLPIGYKGRTMWRKKWIGLFALVIIPAALIAQNDAGIVVSGSVVDPGGNHFPYRAGSFKGCLEAKRHQPLDFHFRPFTSDVSLGVFSS